MNFFIRKPWDLPLRAHTPQAIAITAGLRRRDMLRTIVGAALGLPLVAGLSGCETATDEQIAAAGEVDELLAAAGGPYPAPRNDHFTYDRPETPKRAAAEFT